MRIVAVITARGGSKGLPRKNVLPLAGKPMIAWTIEAAKSSARLERIIVSTDDDEIAEVCRVCGVEVPFMRPPELAEDGTPHIDVVEHAVRWLESQDGCFPDYVLLLQPTSPLRTGRDIDAAIQIAESSHPPAVVGVCEAQQHPALVKRLCDDGTLADFIPNPTNAYLRRQDLPPAYFVNGAIYLNQRESLAQARTFIPPGARPCIMSVEDSIDVDTAWELRVAELMLSERLKGF
jgi:CMP-N,N'-diacetyllegionaminic acid synthase